MVDCGPQAPIKPLATAVQRKWMCHIRTVLSAGVATQQRCKVVLSACCLSGLRVHERGKTDKILPVPTYENRVRPHAEKSGESSYLLPRTHFFSICHARYTVRIAPKRRRACPAGLPLSTSSAFRLKVRVRKDMLNKKKNRQTQLYIYSVCT